MADEFKTYLKKAIEAINILDLERAQEYIMEAMARDAGAPEPHNLLGILAEYQSNRQLAAKHYRASAALDPTYLPAQNNLSRVTSSNGFITKPRDLGLGEEKEIYVEFDQNNVGYVKRKRNPQEV